MEFAPRCEQALRGRSGTSSAALSLRRVCNGSPSLASCCTGEGGPAAAGQAEGPQTRRRGGEGTCTRRSLHALVSSWPDRRGRLGGLTLLGGRRASVLSGVPRSSLAVSKRNTQASDLIFTSQSGPLFPSPARVPSSTSILPASAPERRITSPPLTILERTHPPSSPPPETVPACRCSWPPS